VGHKDRLAPKAKCLVGGMMRFSQRLRKRHMNKKAAKVFVEEVDPFQPDDKGPEAGGDERGLANQFMARTHAAPEQG